MLSEQLHAPRPRARAVAPDVAAEADEHRAEGFARGGDRRGAVAGEALGVERAATQARRDRAASLSVADAARADAQSERERDAALRAVRFARVVQSFEQRVRRGLRASRIAFDVVVVVVS